MLLIGFCRKEAELVDCAYLAQLGVPVWVLYWHELRIAMLQPVGDARRFANTLVQLLASHLSLFATRRLLLQTLDSQYRKKRPSGTSPRLSEWIEAIDNVRASPTSRLGQYREAALYSLGQIYREFGDVLNYAASDFLDRLFALRGCVVIVTSGLSVEMESLLASLIINHGYQSRAGANPDTLEELVFVLDDALPLVRESRASDTEGGNPLSQWVFMGRSRKIGFVISSQNYSLVSQVVRNNSDTVLCFGAYGRDARELATDLHLTPEQAAVLPRIRPGEVVTVARSVWPQAVYGRVPEVK